MIDASAAELTAQQFLSLAGTKIGAIMLRVRHATSVCLVAGWTLIFLARHGQAGGPAHGAAHDNAE
jgi:hypothetical protein